MPRPPKGTLVMQEPPSRPHHILTQVEKSSVGKLQVKTLKGDDVADFEPVVSMEDIRDYLKVNHGPGRYIVIGYDVDTNARLRDHAAVEISNPGDDAPTLGASVFLQTEASRLDEERRELNKLRERALTEQKAIQEEATRRREGQQNEAAALMMGFLKAEREADRARQEREKELQRQFEEKQAILEKEFRMKQAEAERKAQEKEQKIQAELQAARDRLEADRLHLNDTMFKMVQRQNEERLQEQELAHSRQLELIRQEMSLQIKTLEAQSKLEMERREESLKKKYEPDVYSKIPERLAEVIIERRIDQDFPVPNAIERVLKQVTALVSNIDQHMPQVSQIISGILQQKAGVQPPPAPVVQQLESAVDLDDYEEPEDDYPSEPPEEETEELIEV